MRLPFGKDWKNQLLWTLIGVLLAILAQYVVIPVFSPHSNVEVIINRIYSLIGTNSTITDPDLIFLSSINGTEKIFLLKNVKNKTTILTTPFQLYAPAEFACCENTTYYIITIRNIGNALAHEVEIKGGFTIKPNITTNPPDAFISFGQGAYSNQYDIKINELSSEPVKINMITQGLSNITSKIYVDGEELGQEKIIIVDSVIIDYVSSFKMGNCTVVVPTFSNFSYPMLLQLKGTNVDGYNLRWESVYP